MEEQILADAYGIIADLWCSPQDVNMNEIRNDAQNVVAGLLSIEEKSAAALSKFLSADKIAEEDYIDLFELEPKCSLYLGSHSFEEPKSCAGAGVSDRNKYMIDIQGVYRHFGQAISGNELPDYLPMMINFLSLTIGKRNDAIRGKLIKEYIQPFLSPMRKRLEELKTPYLHLFDAMEKILNYDSGTAAYQNSETKTCSHSDSQQTCQCQTLNFK